MSQKIHVWVEKRTFNANQKAAGEVCGSCGEGSLQHTDVISMHNRESVELFITVFRGSGSQQQAGSGWAAMWGQHHLVVSMENYIPDLARKNVLPHTGTKSTEDLRWKC